MVLKNINTCSRVSLRYPPGLRRVRGCGRGALGRWCGSTIDPLPTTANARMNRRVASCPAGLARHCCCAMCRCCATMLAHVCCVMSLVLCSVLCVAARIECCCVEWAWLSRFCLGFVQVLFSFRPGLLRDTPGRPGAGRVSV